MQGNGTVRAPEAAGNPSSLSSDEKRRLVQRVVNGHAFRRSPTMRAFLLYITEHAISGEAEKLKEQVIGTDVLGRKPDYDPAGDNIVRVRAHELRERLEKHFASEGVEEQVVITVPKGAYVPEFVPRATSVLPEPALPIATTPVQAANPPRKEWASRRYWLFFVASILITILSTITLTLYALRGDRRDAANLPSGAMRDFWNQFFNQPDKEIKLVYADTNFALWQDMNGKTLTLGDYLSREYLNVPDDKLLEVAARRTTSPADLLVSVHMATLAAKFGGQANPQYARNVNVEFFHHGNIVLIGSHRSNPWMEVYEPYLNFELQQDVRSGAPEFVNRSPQSREAAVYAIPARLVSHGDEEKEVTSYGVLALLKGCGDRGFLILDDGLNMQATEAVGDLITDPQRLDALLRGIGHKPGTNVAPFEALIQITSLPGAYDKAEVVAYRLRPASACVVN